jgi:hypothetical protein
VCRGKDLPAINYYTVSKQTLNINSDAVVKWTNKLENIKRSDLPVAIRNTLNSAAKDMKTDSLLKSADKEFIQRKPTFFKFTSKYFKANGFDIKTMHSIAGFVGNSQAVADLEKQETGGKIGSRELIPLKPSRVSRSERKNIRANERIAEIRKQRIVWQKDSKGNSRGSRFAKAVSVAGLEGLVMGELEDKQILWRINSLEKTKDGKYKLTALYAHNKSETVKVGKTNFALKASEMTKKKIEDFFIREAKIRIEKSLK